MMKFIGVLSVVLAGALTVLSQVADKPDDAAPFQHLLTKELLKMAKNIRKQLRSEMTELVQELRQEFLQTTVDFEVISESTNVEIQESMMKEKNLLEERFMKVVNYSNHRMEELTNYLQYLQLAVKGGVDPYDFHNLLTSETPVTQRQGTNAITLQSTDTYLNDQSILLFTEESSSYWDNRFFNSTSPAVAVMHPGFSNSTSPAAAAAVRPGFSNSTSPVAATAMHPRFSNSTSPATAGAMHPELANSTSLAEAAAMRPEDLTMTFNIIRPRSCYEVYLNGETQDGIYLISPEGPGGVGIAVWCVMAMTEGGWTVILARLPDVEHVEFSRPIHDYAIGFGQPDGHYWIGLLHLENLCGLQAQRLKVYMEDWDGNNATAHYDDFSIAKANDSWVLEVSGYHTESTAGDALTSQNGAVFTYTPELGAWWHSIEGGATPTGKYYYTQDVPQGREAGVEWPTWKGHKTSLKSLLIMISPKN